jgi:hypothetical protein
LVEHDLFRKPVSTFRDHALAVTSLHDIVPAQQVLEAAPRGLPLPWWAKIGAKIVLSRAFPSYRARKALGLFLHGNLDQNVEQHLAFVRTCWRSMSASRAAKLLRSWSLGRATAWGRRCSQRRKASDGCGLRMSAISPPTTWHSTGASPA